MSGLMAYAAELYHHFLEENKLALQKINIIKKGKVNDFVRLTLAMRHIHTESLALRIGEEMFAIDGENIQMQYNDEQGIMDLYSKQTIIDSMLNENVELFSDLKFLVKNIQKFYEKHENMQSLFDTKRLKHISQNMSLLGEMPQIPSLDTYQNHALNILFKYPISYIWGPPGSGKTKGVLLEALLFLLQKQKKVLLLAPTNNALEQILFAILPRIQEKGYRLDHIIRLGIPTKTFLRHYEEVCDPTVVQQESNLFVSKKDYKQRIKESLIIASTLDSFIKKHHSIEDIEHIFLDEAPYAPLIKALTLSYFQAPLTLLGDHKQLGPVCELGEKDFHGEQCIMKSWFLSALYIESFHKKHEELFNTTTHLPLFKEIRCAKLIQSYRYGTNLTNILEKFIYHIGLKGLNKTTEILYIDSGKSFITPKKYESASEAKEISFLSLSLVDEELQKQRNDIFAIITPFNAQRNKILEFCPYLKDKDKVLTIHKSQGLEFDIVVFSPVLLHYHLTNSTNPFALCALNVAISRAREKIIIVCDVNFWKQQNQQFLCALLQQAKPLSIRSDYEAT